MDNHEFGCEKLCPERFKTGVCAFKIIDGDKDTTYWVVAPPMLSDQMSGEYKIETPNDGHVCAFCMNEQDALMVASSIRIVAGVAAKDKAEKKALADIAQKVAKDIGFDLDALKAEVKRLKSDGKSAKEISEILKPRMEEFSTKKPQSDTKGGEW
jgi:hypothetical protein